MAFLEEYAQVSAKLRKGQDYPFNDQQDPN